MKLALEIIEREIAQRTLANQHKHLRHEEVKLEIDSLNKVKNLIIDAINNEDKEYWQAIAESD